MITLPWYFTTQYIQPYHMDATPTDRILVDKKTVQGCGDGFSAFLGLTTRNTIWVATLDNDNQIVNRTLVEFGKGDCVVIPYGVIHAGDKNRTGAVTFKLFSEVYTTCKPDATSQLWVIVGEGLASGKKATPYQFDNIDECEDNFTKITASKKRKHRHMSVEQEG